MTPHPNDMSVWSDIACTRGHTRHKTTKVVVDLRKHGYQDLPQVPSALRPDPFEMYIWDVIEYPVDGSTYCPAHDAVSETIVSHRVWEPQETILALRVFKTAAPDQIFVDLGAQIGWFSLLAATQGVHVEAYDAEEECVRILKESAALNGWMLKVVVHHSRLGHNANFPQGLYAPVRLAKIDVEGAEDVAVEWLMPAIEQGLIDHLLIEVSPVFADYYPDLVADLMQHGYRAYFLPPKHRPPLPLDNPEQDLAPYEIVDAHESIPGIHQASVWFQREGAQW